MWAENRGEFCDVVVSEIRCVALIIDMYQMLECCLHKKI